MFNLVITMLAITVFGLAVTAGSGYLSFDSIHSAINAGKIESSIVSISSASAQYRMLEDEMPADIGVLLNSGYMKYTPEFPGNIHLSPSDSLLFDKNSGILSLCIGSSSVTSLDYDSMLKVEINLGVENVVIASSCHESTDMVAPTNFPASVWLTYRLQ